LFLPELVLKQIVSHNCIYSSNHVESRLQICSARKFWIYKQHILHDLKILPRNGKYQTTDRAISKLQY